MSSWANRKVYSKRDISKIPEGLRPTIITRSERPEVILSESFQKYENEVIENDSHDKTMNELLYPNTYKQSTKVTKQVYNFTSHNAVELTYDGQSFVFVILRNIQTINDNDFWISSYNSIRTFYKNKIIIIDDNSKINTVNGKLINTEIIYSEWNGAGEVLPYYYFLKHKWADKIIFLHDTMFLHRPFTPSELKNDISFHWHFMNNNKDTQKNLQKINTYLSLFSNELQEYARTSDLWRGCFGCASIISYDLLNEIEEKHKLINTLVMNVRTRKDRQCFERIFGMIFYYENKIDNSNCSNFGDIMSYPFAFDSLFNTFEKGQHNINQTNYNTAIVKVWRGR